MDDDAQTVEHRHEPQKCGCPGDWAIGHYCPDCHFSDHVYYVDNGYWDRGHMIRYECFACNVMWAVPR
jgi:hypothetical protein